MTAGNNTQSEGYPSLPPHLFQISDSSGAQCNLTPFLQAGAKLTVLFAAYQKQLGIKAATGDKHYFRLYRALKSWERAGLIEIRKNAYDSFSIEPDQRAGIYCRATAEAYTKTPYLINEVQNSKTFCKTPQTPQDERWRAEIPERCSFMRMHAIRRLCEVKNHTWFKRNPQTHMLNPMLQKKLTQVENIFQSWKEEADQKIILLRNLNTGEIEEVPYKTRFTDTTRKLKNVAIYNTGIENSLKKWKTGVFLTLTTDPMLWMMPEGETFTRYIKDQETGKTYQFEGVGRGESLYAADRHESEAWRMWYEKETQRRGYRVPYIRCVEFQENGLIHTHILLFGIEWDRDWYDFANEWGTVYGQGFMNKAYEVVNDGEKWVWKREKPTDAKERAPADYLKKYLIKSMYDESGFSLYFATNKRFFTMSQTVRYYSFDEKIEEEEWAKIRKSEIPFDYVGACTKEEIPETVKRYFTLKDKQTGFMHKPPITSHGAPGGFCDKHKPYLYPFQKEPAKPEIQPVPAIENPDEFDGIPAIVPELELQTRREEEEYQRLLQIEREERKKRREELRKKRKEK